NVLIFEHDVSFRSVASTRVRDIVEELDREAWDVVFFGYLSPPDDGLKGPLATWPPEIVGAHFYPVNGRFIAPMREYMSKCESRPAGHPDGGPMTADGAYNHVRFIMPQGR